MAKPVRADKTIDLEPGEPMIFGKERDKGLRVDGWDVEVCDAADAQIWDPTTFSAAPAFLMSQMDANPGLPTPLGVFRAVKEKCYEAAVHAQIDQATAEQGPGEIEDLVIAGERWEIE